LTERASGDVTIAAGIAAVRRADPSRMVVNAHPVVTSLQRGISFLAEACAGVEPWHVKSRAKARNLG